MNRRSGKKSANSISTGVLNHSSNSSQLQSQPTFTFSQISNLPNLSMSGIVLTAPTVQMTPIGSASANQPRVCIPQQLQNATASTSYGSRRSSMQSFQDISEPASDNDSEDDNAPGDKSLSFRERRREAHTQSEQKRRDAIKKGYQELEQELPNVKDDTGNQKSSKAVVLQKSIDYLMFLEEQKKKQAEELESLKRDLLGLQIMKQTYDKMAANFKNLPDEGETPVSDEVKFKVYQGVMNRLFSSFDARVTATSFADLSGSAFNWLEEWCTPHHLHQITKAVLTAHHSKHPSDSQQTQHSNSSV